MGNKFNEGPDRDLIKGLGIVFGMLGAFVLVMMVLIWT